LKYTIDEVPNLRELKISNLVELPEEIVYLKNLEVLDLSNNQLKRVPPEVGYLTNLKVLNLSGTGLRYLNQFPWEMWTLPKLEVLDLSYNTDLKQLPKEIGRLSTLRTLFTTNTQIKKLPAEIINIHGLQISEYSSYKSDVQFFNQM